MCALLTKNTTVNNTYNKFYFLFGNLFFNHFYKVFAKLEHHSILCGVIAQGQSGGLVTRTTMKRGFKSRLCSFSNFWICCYSTTFLRSICSQMLQYEILQNPVTYMTPLDHGVLLTWRTIISKTWLHQLFLNGSDELVNSTDSVFFHLGKKNHDFC